MNTAVGELVTAAQAGDKSAWVEIVHEFEELVWRVARSHRLNEADALDVCQSTWLKAATKLDTLREPARFAGWITTIAERESLSLIRRLDRERPHNEVEVLGGAQTTDDAEQPLLERELIGRLRKAFAQLPQACRNLLALLTTDPPTTYKRVSELLAIPIGSIGPNRQRCLSQLRTTLATVA